MTKVITDINVTENFILIGKEKAQRKSAYFRAVIVKVTESGPQIAALGDLIK